MSYVRDRFARSIEARVATAIRLAEEANGHLQSHLHQLMAQQQAHLQLLMAEQQAANRAREEREAQLQADVADLAAELRLAQAELQRRCDRIIREHHDRTTEAMVASQSSLGSVSAELTDAQRRQSEMLERLVDRLESLEHATRSTPTQPAPPS